LALDPWPVFSFVVIDLNDLKGVNDEYGHQEGDRLLRTFADAVKDNIRGTDYFARIGGDEFALILNELNRIDSSKVFLRIMQDLESNHTSLPYKITFSYGITLYPDEATNSDALYVSSDEKMYVMKRRYKEVMK